MFKTDFICILTSGHTVDGREVAQVVLEQIAETYNPTTYNARINIDHSDYGSKLGSVLAVKVEGNQLLAQLKPNDYFLYLIQQGQYLHTSCEIQMDFAKTGKAYLTGLAVTDSPASLGTTELHLSQQKAGAAVFNTNNGITPKKPTLLSKLFNQDNRKEDEMTDKATLELLAQMQASNTVQTEALTALTSGITALTEKLTAETIPNKPDVLVPLEIEQPGGTKGVEQAFTEKLSALTSKFETQQETIADLTEKLSKVTDEQSRREATGGQDGDDEEDVL